MENKQPEDDLFDRLNVSRPWSRVPSSLMLLKTKAARGCLGCYPFRLACQWHSICPSSVGAHNASVTRSRHPLLHITTRASRQRPTVFFSSFLHSFMRCPAACARELRLSLDFCTGKDLQKRTNLFWTAQDWRLCRKVSCNLVFWNCFPSLANFLLRGQGNNSSGWWQHGTMTPSAYYKEKFSLAFTPISISSVLLCLLQTGILNKHLQDLMEGLTAKVFRTYNASITLQQQLKELTARK